MIKEVTVFETTDGQRFPTWDEAYEHQFTLNWSNLSENDVVIKDRFGDKASYEYWFNNFDSAFYVVIFILFFLLKIFHLPNDSAVT